MQSERPVLTPSEKRWILAESGVAIGTLRNWLNGNAREASAQRIAVALKKLAERERHEKDADAPDQR